MKKLIKQVIGIDVGKNELVVSLARMYDDLRQDIGCHKVFDNSANGHLELLEWASKKIEGTLPVSYVMEATGVYHESLAYFLNDNYQVISIVLPSKISNYAKTLNIKTVTDKTASEAIA